jgi:hypothetical protein
MLGFSAVPQRGDLIYMINIYMHPSWYKYKQGRGVLSLKHIMIYVTMKN